MAKNEQTFFETANFMHHFHELYLKAKVHCEISLWFLHCAPPRQAICLVTFSRGIPKVSKDHNQRIQAIAEEIASSKYDVVCLQEVWTDNDYEQIKTIVAEIMPYSHYFYR